MPGVHYLLILAIRGLLSARQGGGHLYKHIIKIFMCVNMHVIHDTRSLENQARPFSGCISLFRCASPFNPISHSHSPVPSTGNLLKLYAFIWMCACKMCEYVFNFAYDIVTNHTLFSTFFPTSQTYPCCWYTSNFDGINLTSFFFYLALSSVF